MKREIAKSWAADLRANAHLQAKGELFNGKGYCCLGRLCVLAGVEPEKTDDRYYFYDNRFGLPSEVMDWAGIETRDGEYGNSMLTRDNDGGKTFLEIADIIEANIDEL